MAKYYITAKRGSFRFGHGPLGLTIKNKNKKNNNKKHEKHTPHISIWFIGREVHCDIFGPDPFTTTALIQPEVGKK